MSVTSPGEHVFCLYVTLVVEQQSGVRVRRGILPAGGGDEQHPGVARHVERLRRLPLPGKHAAQRSRLARRRLPTLHTDLLVAVAGRSEPRLVLSVLIYALIFHVVCYDTIM